MHTHHLPFSKNSPVTIPTQAIFYLQQYNHLYFPSLKWTTHLALSEYIIELGKPQQRMHTQYSAIQSV